jgi:hypothetical protein
MNRPISTQQGELFASNGTQSTNNQVRTETGTFQRPPGECSPKWLKKVSKVPVDRYQEYLRRRRLD